MDKQLISQCNSCDVWSSIRQGLLLLAGTVLTLSAQATTYVLPNDDVIGQIQYARSKGSETLIDIARRYDVGFNAIKAANPNVDPWLPGNGTRILIPSRHILPKGPREGIVINVAEMRLYHYTTPKEGPPLVSTYPISIGREGQDTPLGTYKVTKRTRKPTWTLPESVRKEWRADGVKKIPKIIPPGPDNPLGDYAIKLDLPGYLIHGTNKPYSIGMKVSHGCVRMYPEDIDILTHRVSLDTPVRIISESFKYGYKNGALYLEFHQPREDAKVNLAALVNTMNRIVKKEMWSDDWQRIRHVADTTKATAMPVAQLKAKTGKSQHAWWLQLATYNKIQTARNLMNKVEILGVPLTTRGCETGKCRVLAGPFTDRKYMDRVRKKVKWITRLKAYPVPYEAMDDMAELNQHMAALN